jgi:hypothetical protein
MQRPPYRGAAPTFDLIAKGLALMPDRHRRPRRRRGLLYGLIPLIAASLSACGDGPPNITIGIGLDPPPCAAAGNPSACRMQRTLDGEYSQPNVRGR